MSKITTIKGSLFDAPPGSILIHACNTYGVWGAGIAKQFAKRFPGAYKVYAEVCAEQTGLLGTCLLITQAQYTIACLFTSTGYGIHVSPPAQILKATKYAVDDLIVQKGDKSLHTCKINSGLFNVPWEDTLKILEASGEEFTVYDF